MAAKRSVKAAPVAETVSNEDVLVRLFVILEAFESTEENPTATQDMVDEYRNLHQVKMTDTDMFALLSELAEAKIIDGERGQWFITVPDVTEENAESIAREYLSGAVVESKTPAPAVEPVKAADGTNVTVPVSEDSTERRELDASKGERLISEDVVKDGKFIPIESEPFDLPKYIDSLRVQRENGSQDKENWTELDDVDVPAVPDGVNANQWFHAFNSQGVTEKDTYSARLFWAEYVSKQIADRAETIAAIKAVAATNS